MSNLIHLNFSSLGCLDVCHIVRVALMVEPNSVPSKYRMIKYSNSIPLLCYNKATSSK